MAPKMIDAEVRREPEEPRAEQGFAPVGGELPVRGQEDFLEQILSVRSADETTGQAEEPRRMSAVESLERRPIACAAALCQGEIVVPDRTTR